MPLFFGSSDGLFEELDSCLSAMCSVSIGWFVRGITPSVGKLMVQNSVVVDFVTKTKKNFTCYLLVFSLFLLCGFCLIFLFPITQTMNRSTLWKGL